MKSQIKFMWFLLWCHAALSSITLGKTASHGPSLVLGYDKACWKAKSRLVAQVSAVPITCDTGQSCRSFDQTVSLESKAPAMKLNLAEVARRTGVSPDNHIYFVTICEDRNHNGKCDEKPVAQVLRLSGRHMKTLYPEGLLTLDFHNITHVASNCSSL